MFHGIRTSVYKSCDFVRQISNVLNYTNIIPEADEGEEDSSV